MSGLPSILRRLRWTSTLRHLLLVAWGVVWMVPASNYTLRMNNDWIPFEIGARTIVHYHHMWEFSGPALHLFGDTPMLQFGPLPVLLLAMFQEFRPHAVAIGFAVGMIAAGVASFAALEAAAKTLVDSSRHRLLRRRSLALQIVLVPVWSFEIGFWHHLDDTLALACLSFAVLVVARRGPWWAFALLMGTATATKPWAIIATPLLLALPRPVWAKATLVTMAAAAAWWLPFIAADPATVTALGSYRTVVSEGSVLYLLGVHANGDGWLRPLQFGLGMLAVGAIARRGRWSDALLVGSAVRILLDPFSYSYYVMGPMLGALLVDLARVGRNRMPVWTPATLLLVWVVPRLAAHTPVWGHTFGPIHLTALGAVLRAVWALLAIAYVAAPHLGTLRAFRVRRAPVAIG